MTTLISAPTLRDALTALSAWTERHEREGEKNLVFCEDRLTLLAERAVLERTGGTMRTEVTTFARFLSGERQIVSKQGSVMIVSALLAAHERELRVFGKSSAQAVYETLAQLSASQVDAGALRMGAEESEGMLKSKLSDLALLLDEYKAFLEEKSLLDENGYLALLPSKLSEELRGVNVCFFAFPSFTRQALEGVRAALLSAKSSAGIFIAGEGDLYTGESYTAFLRTAEECGEVHTRRAPCSLEGDALALKNILFAPEVFSRPRIRAHSVYVFSSPDETREAETVCALIRKKIDTEGLRYRDFAVLVPGKESFLTVEKVFSAFRIPFYADRKKPYSEHPFCAFALDLLQAVADGGTPASVDAVCASLYFGEGENYRNYLARYGGYRGAADREIKPAAEKEYDLGELNACRARLRELLSVFPRRGTGREYAEAVHRLIALSDAEKRGEELASRREGAERNFLSLDVLSDTLEEIGRIAGEEKFSAREFRTLLYSALSAAEISILPRRNDAVFVGDATESKLSGSAVVFCLSLTDALPRTSQDTAVITDGEMERLSRLKVQIEPAIAVVNARARESLALNLCAFKREIYLSCPLRAGGKETRRSEALSYVLRAFELPPMPEIFPYDCCEREPALLAMLRYREGYARGARSGLGGTDGDRFASVREALFSRGEKKLCEDVLSGGKKEPVPAFGELVLKGEISPTLLEKYFECPYAGFMSRALRLKEREERGTVAADAGSFVHAVLASVAASFNDVKSEEECRALAEEKARELLRTPLYSSFSDTGEGEYAGEWLVAECREVTAAAYRQLADSSFRVEHAEEEVRLPALALKGRADRVDGSDGYVRVIDYKTGSFDAAPTAYYTGRKLQLELYLLAASEGRTPAGAFYFPAADGFAGEGEEKFRMKGFFSAEEEVLRRMDTVRTEGKSAHYDGGGKGKSGLPGTKFPAFLSYAVLVSEGAEREIRAGNISPSPYEGACAYCKLGGMCAYTGAARKVPPATCEEIASIAERAKEERE